MQITADNVPGVPGIGVKTAAQLINEYGYLEELLERAEEIKQPKRREALCDNANLARISKQLVQLDQDAPVPVPLKDLTTHDPNKPELMDFLQQQGFKSIITRLGGTPDPSIHEIKKEDEEVPFPPVDKNEYTLINTQKQLKEWVERAYKTGTLAIDTETTSLTPAKAELVGISISCEMGSAGRRQTPSEAASNN